MTTTTKKTETVKDAKKNAKTPRKNAGRIDADSAQTEKKNAETGKPAKEPRKTRRSSEEMLRGLLAHQETLRKDFADALETDPKTIQTALDVARATIETLKGNPAGFLTAALQLIVSIDSIADLWNKDESEFRYSLPETEKHKAEILIIGLDALYIAAHMDDKIKHIQNTKDLTLAKLHLYGREEKPKTVKERALTA